MTALQGRWALVTGASGGIGAEIARRVAVRGANVVLVARSREPMEALADELRRDPGVEALVVPADLTRPETPAELARTLDDAEISVSVLVNNAGFGLYGDFFDHPWSSHQKMIDLDVKALVELTHIFGERMLERGQGHILQVSSIGGFTAAPTYASYAAAKAFVLSFGEATAYELRGSGVTMTTLCPGVTDTGFFTGAGQKPNRIQRFSMMSPADVAEIGVDAMLRGKPVVVPGILNVITAALTGLVPRPLRVMLAAKSMMGEKAGPPKALEP